MGFFTLYMFLLSGLLGSIIFLRTAYSEKDFVADRTTSRYALLSQNYGNFSSVQNFIASRELKGQQFSQVNWLAFDLGFLNQSAAFPRISPPEFWLAHFRLVAPADKKTVIEALGTGALFPLTRVLQRDSV